MTVTETIIKWYNKLEIGQLSNANAELILAEAEKTDVEKLSFEELWELKNPRLNLAYYLYHCEETLQKYNEIGIDEAVLLDTFRDIKIWTETYGTYSGGLFGVEEIRWLNRHLAVNIFRLGRLQFAFAKSKYSDTELGLEEGENTIEVHIPRDGKLTEKECIESFIIAREFFEKCFPEYKFRFFTCESWLLDENLRKFLGENSNILKFGDLFKKIHSVESDMAIRFVFNWKDTKDNIKDCVAENNFQKKMKDYIMQGGTLTTTCGVRKK